MKTKKGGHKSKMSANNPFLQRATPGIATAPLVKPGKVDPPTLGELSDGVWVIRTETGPRFIRKAAEKLIDLPDVVLAAKLVMRRDILVQAISEVLASKEQPHMSVDAEGKMSIKMPSLDPLSIARAIINKLTHVEQKEAMDAVTAAVGQTKA